MFDDIHIHTPSYPGYVRKHIEVTEHRAPTDDSIALLNEMTQKALDNIARQLTTGNNYLQITAFVYDDYRMQDRHWCAKLTLNGKDHVIEVVLPYYQYDSHEKMARALYDRVVDILAREIMEPLWHEMQRSIR